MRTGQLTLPHPLTASEGSGQQPLVEISALARVSSGEACTTPLHDINLTVGRGEYVGIVGDSDSGTAAMLNVLALLERPSTGEYRFAGRETSTLSRASRAHMRCTHIGIAFGPRRLLPHRTVLDNVLMALLYSSVPRDERRERATDAIERTALSPYRDTVAHALPAEQRGRALVARAIATDPHVLLADDPQTPFASRAAESILALYDELHAAGQTIVTVVHDPRVGARARRHLRMCNGRLSARS